MTAAHRFQRPVGPLLAMLLLVSALGSARVQAASECFNDTDEAKAKGTVVLDAGHGGSDPGTSNTTSAGELLVEKNLTLDIAFRTRDLLTTAGYKVCMTRVDDTGMGNSERGEYANSVGGTVYVSIHLNGSSDPRVNYTKAFYGKRNKDEAFARHVYTEGLAPGLINKELGVSGSSVGQFANGALLQASMEATLTESVFLTNDAEADRLATTITPGNRRDQIAQALANGITTWPGTAPGTSASKPGPKR